jgi:hypothetical protein
MFTPSRRRIRLIGLLTLLTLVSFSPVFAAKPETVTIRDPYTVVYDDLCDFPVQLRGVGSIRYATYTDRQGNPMMTIENYRLRDIFTNLETGKSIFTADAGIDKYTIDRHGDEIFASIGLQTRIVVPGQGIIAARVGRLVVNLTTGEVVSIAGPRDEWDTVDSAICAALS